MDSVKHDIRLFQTFPQNCSYIEGQQSVSIIPDPSIAMTHSLYQQLASIGFRRSGNEVYTPHCPECSACLPLRVPVPYSPNRNQRRTLQNNQDLVMSIVPASFIEEHFDLYSRYLKTRHANSQMAETNEENYKDFLISAWCETVFLEFRRKDKLVAVAVTDVFSNALSAVYTFFEPTMEKNSLGTYCILKQLALVEQMSLNCLYLGYWINQCREMSYKANFKPHEIYQKGRWTTVLGGHQDKSS
ncbi:MAG: arginyltransferase [Gammaproteobacteria bacterium]